MMRIFRAIPLIAILFMATPAQAVGVDAEVLKDPAQEALAQNVMAQLRCLVCQNQSIVDSDAPLAADLRGLVRKRIADGDTPQQVKDYLVARYGDWVLLKPPVKSNTLLLWGAPLGILVLGAGGILAARMRRGAAPLSDEDTAAADALLERDG